MNEFENPFDEIDPSELSDYSRTHEAASAEGRLIEKTATEGIWDSAEAIESLKMERSVHPEETNETLTKRILEQAAPMAAQSIVHLALHSTNDNTRLNAAKYVTDRLLDAETESGKAVWERMMAEVISDAELHANTERG